MWYWMSGITDDGGLVLYCNEPKNKGGLQLYLFPLYFCDDNVWEVNDLQMLWCCCMLHVIDGEKKRGKERRKKEEKKKKKRRKNQLFCYILRPIFVGGACGGLYGRGALAPPHNPSDPTKLALRLISTHYSMLVYVLYIKDKRHFPPNTCTCNLPVHVVQPLSVECTILT